MSRNWINGLIVVLLSIVLYHHQKEDSYSEMSKSPVVVIGSGLAGLTSASKLLDRKIPVLLLEKTKQIGGNSIKASSGINGCVTSTQIKHGVNDSVKLFYEDTVKSSGIIGDRTLQNVLVNESKDAIDWLKTDVGLALDVINQLGGHSSQRTHRSSGVPPGFEIISKLKERVLNHELLELQLGARLVGIDVDKIGGGVKGIRVVDEETNDEKYIPSNHVILATGGFGFSKDLIQKYKPEYADLPTTNGNQTLGEGHLLIESIGGELIDMDQIQIHPTGFIKQDDPSNNWKFLAAESLRGIGGVLLNTDNLERFVNELDTRDKVSAAIREQEGQRAYLVLNDAMYEDFKFQIDFYTKMKLFERTTAREKFGERASKFIQSLEDHSREEKDKFDRTHKAHVFHESTGVDTELFIGEVTPVVHFTMGGVKINEFGQVLKKKDTQGSENVIGGLYAIGEVSGGVHGRNRLGGNSLLECVVFGSRVGNTLQW